MTNSLAPAFARMTYTGLTHPHHMTLGFMPAEDPVPGSIPIARTKSGLGSIAMDECISSLLVVLRPMFPTTVDFGLVEFYSQAVDTGERTFLTGYDMGVAGTDADDDAVAASRASAIFKTQGGNQLKVVLMESIYVPNQNLFYATADAKIKALADYVIDADSWIMGYDNSYAYAFTHFVTKTDDGLRKYRGYTVP